MHAYLQRHDLEEELGPLVVEHLGAVRVVAHQVLLLHGAHGAERADGRGALEEGITPV
jgi:hypothetical protein